MPDMSTFTGSDQPAAGFLEWMMKLPKPWNVAVTKNIPS